MRIPTKVHGLIDYAGGVSLVLAAFALGWAGRPEGISFIVVGVVLILNAAFTDFEYGIARVVQLPIHLWIDGLLGLAIALSPWLLSFDRAAWLPHLLVGGGVASYAFFTHTMPGYDRRTTGARDAL